MTNAAVVFADISGSTQLYVQLGDAAAQSLIARTLKALTEVTTTHHGIVIKTIGDEVMCRFNSPDDGFEAAMEMQRLLRQIGGRAGDLVRVGIRVGLHWGEAVEEGGDLFGDAVNVAARVAAVARRDQIVTTEETVAALDESRRSLATAFDRVALKGRTGEMVLCLVNWDDATDATKMRTSLPKSVPATAQRRLEISFDDQTLSLFIEGKAMTMGRSKECSLIVETNFASRQHARVTMRRGKFVLLDESTNGTYIMPGGLNSGAEEVFIKREEYLLPEQSAVSLGQSCKASDARHIQFKINLPVDGRAKSR